MFSIDGIVSGFDTTSIIESLLGFQQTQVDTFNSRKAEIATKQTSFKGIEAQMLTLQSSLSRLNRTTDSVFDVSSATSSNEDVLTAVADSGAASGRYQLAVDSLATAHQVGSQGFASSSEQLATGDITFQVGANESQTISLDQSNNTVSGFVTTINEQVEDVNASVIFDQGSDNYRILLTSALTGEENEITVTSNLSGTGATPDFSGPAVQEATNAVITLGSGPGAITAQYSSNTVEGLIEGVTLDLKTVSDGSTVTIDVAADTEPAKEAIEAFVADYNSIMSFIDAQTRYEPETEQASPLLGNRNVNTIKNRLLSLVSETVTTNGSVNRLAQIGVDLNAQGRLEIDSVKLDNALSGNLEGVDAKDIRNLFGLNASSDNTGIEFLAGGTRTLGSASPYEVNITQAATQAAATGTNAVAETTTIDSSNNTFQITVDGIVSDELTLEAGDYTRNELATRVEELINQSNELGNHNVTVSLDGDNKLQITSEAYGDESTISSISGAASNALGFDGTENAEGTDVEGFFVVDGVEEIANGSGRVLIGDPENENTADLQLRITLTPDQVTAAVEGSVQVSRGVSGNLNKYIDDVLDSETGLMQNVNEDFELRLSSIDQSIERVEDITESKREFLLAQFTALEGVLSELQTTGSFISSQLGSLSSLNTGSNN